ncbi:MAG: FAD-dependent oxidoreductase, partial [Burkholderiaceae bacterium]|nr:FAD-dependent oxidoreductase [Burkholderiaceae bacterium]
MTAKRLLLLLIVAATVAAFFTLDLGRYLSPESFRAHRAAIDAFHAAHPVLTVAAYAALYVAVAALSLPVATALTLIGGALFGPLLGTVVVSFAASVGALLAFLLSRFLLRDWVRRRFGDKLAPIDAGIRREGAFYLFALRLVPAFPFFLVNLAMGLTAMRAPTFYWVSQLGMLPATALYVYAGAQLGRFELTPALFVALALLGVFPLAARKSLAWLRARRVYARWRPLKPRRFDYDLVVIGAGAAGLVSAYLAAALRARVALVERHRMGGDCLYTGCVPSKTLLASARLAARIARASEYGLRVPRAQVDFAAVMQRVADVIAAIEPHDSAARYTALGVECIAGAARLTSPWTVQVQTADGPRTLAARAIVIATGARPVVPPIPGLQQVQHFTSETIWTLREPPARLLILGGGPIGCELAQAFARLGSAVTLVEQQPRLLPREDEDAAALLARRLAADGVRVLTAHRAVRFERSGDAQTLLAEGAGGPLRIDFDAVLLALGRRADLDGLGLTALDLETTADGTLATDGWLRTRYPNITACGDVIGPYQFTHLAAHQAWYATFNALFGRLRKLRYDDRVLPWAVFTDPEIARV